MGHARGLKIGLVGTGVAARKLHGAAIQTLDDISVHSVYGRSLAKAESLAKEVGGTAYDDFDRMLDDSELDAIVIANPDGLHAEAALKAAAAGKSVLMEKPMALSSKECESVNAAFARSDAKLGLAYRMRFHLGHQNIVDRVHAGEFGQLRHVRAHAALLEEGDGGWRNADPKTGKWWVLSKFGTHLLDQIHWIVNRPTSAINGFSGFLRSRQSQNEAEASGSWSYDDGPMAQLFVSNLWGNGESRMELHFDRNIITLRGTLGYEGGGHIEINREPLVYDARPEFPPMLQDFADAIREDRDPLVSGEVGLENVRLLEMFNRDAEVLAL